MPMLIEYIYIMPVAEEINLSKTKYTLLNAWYMKLE